MVRLLRAYLLGICAVAVASTGVAGQTLPPGFSEQYLDRGADACTDFHQFACGGWMQTHPLPPDRARYGRLQDLADRNDLIIRALLEQAAVRGRAREADTKRIGDFYASCLDQPTIRARGLTPIAPLLAAIRRTSDRRSLLRVAGTLARLGIPGFLVVGSAPDVRDPARFVATFEQGTLGLPDRDLYLRDDDRSRTLRAAYRIHLRTLFTLAGESADRASDDSDGVFAVETALARAVFDRVTLRDPRRRDNPTTLSALAADVSGLEIPVFLRAVGAPTFSRLNVINPGYLRDLDAALGVIPLSSWRSYLVARLLSAMAPALPEPIEGEYFRFTEQVLSGQQAAPPRWKRCTAAVAGTPGDDRLGEIVGRLYVRDHFGEASRQRVEAMVSALERSLAGTITTLDWMGPDTRRRALEKLREVNHKIGAPGRWRDFSRVRIRRDRYAENLIAIRVDDVRRALSWIDRPVDRSVWLMTPQTVNAYYAPPLNEVVFPAGILQPPFFDATQDDAVNFGAAGAFIGHELSHGFDDQGRRFDGRGALQDWWTPEDDRAFRARAACFVDQYGRDPAVDDIRVNGALTLGENVADNAGVRVAYLALMEHLDTAPPTAGAFSAEQRFFLAWAQVWCENTTPEDARRRAQIDPHAPARWRTNGVLRNSQEFRKAFGCAPGTPMAPVNTCRVW